MHKPEASILGGARGAGPPQYFSKGGKGRGKGEGRGKVWEGQGREFGPPQCS